MSHERPGLFRRISAALGGALKGRLLGKSMNRFSGSDEYWDRVIAAQLGWPCPDRLHVPEPEYEPVHGWTRSQRDDYLARNPGYRSNYEVELQKHGDPAALQLNGSSLEATGGESQYPRVDRRTKEAISPRRRKTTVMNAGEQLREGQVQSQGSQHQETEQQVSRQQAQKIDAEQTATRTGQGTWRSEAVMSGLEKALDALFKAQDHLNKAVDQGGDGLSKMTDGIGRSLRALQREVSQVIYRLGKGG